MQVWAQVQWYGATGNLDAFSPLPVGAPPTLHGSQNLLGLLSMPSPTKQEVRSWGPVFKQPGCLLHQLTL